MNDDMKDRAPECAYRFHGVFIDLEKNPQGDYREGSIVGTLNDLSDRDFQAVRDVFSRHPRYRFICVGWRPS